MTDGPLIIEVPEPAAWPEGPTAGLVWPELELPPAVVQSDAAEVLPADFASETVLMPALVETVVLPASSEQGLPAPPQFVIGTTAEEPSPAPGYPILFFETGLTSDPDDVVPSVIQ